MTQDNPTKHVEATGFKEHPVHVGDEKSGWTVLPAQLQFLHYDGADRLFPFGVAQMDNGEVILLASAERVSPAHFQPVTAFSRDGGATWSPFQIVPDVPSGRPMVLTYFGEGKLSFQGAGDAASSVVRLFSFDYGRTWPQRLPLTTPEGQGWNTEGNALVELGGDDEGDRVTEVGYKAYSAKSWPKAFDGYIRWSSDGGRTWEREAKPHAWQITDQWRDHHEVRGISEGSLARAANGDLVAALRLDMHPRFYLDGAEEAVDFDDSLEGLAVSISKDDGRTWSPMQTLFEAGRHHPHLMNLPDGRIVMTYIVRVDVRDGKLASYRRGCEALISDDHGRTWDLSKRYILDECEFFDGQKWFNGETGHLFSTLLDDGHILTTYGKYFTNGACLIKWKP